MNYQKHYTMLINKGKNRVLGTYSERHHIVPRCLGGDNSKENLVRLNQRKLEQSRGI